MNVRMAIDTNWHQSPRQMASIVMKAVMKADTAIIGTHSQWYPAPLGRRQMRAPQYGRATHSYTMSSLPGSDARATDSG